LVFGAVLAAGGGVVTLWLVAAVTLGAVESGTEGDVVIGGLFIGGGPLVLGFWLLARGRGQMPWHPRTLR
jgi:hypothetical protein